MPTALHAKNGKRELALTVQVWKEGATHVAYSPELDISSCAKTAARAKLRLREALELFLEEAQKMGTLDDILSEAGFERHGKVYQPRPLVAREKVRLILPAA